MITKTSAEAQNQFGKLLDTAQREPVAITRHGRPAAYVVSPEYVGDIERILLERHRRAGSELKAWRKEMRKSEKQNIAALEQSGEEPSR